MLHHFVRSAWLALCLCPLAHVQASDLEPALTALQAVGPRGAGHAQAVAALRQVSQASVAELPRILAAMDDAGPLADNWLRGAAESVADRAIRSGAGLPAKRLERFMLDTHHDPDARRLAYELLARIDDTAGERLIPGMLHDPGVDFRRDAVDRLLSQGERFSAANDRAAAKQIYLKAISGAVDDDQVKTLARRLARLGHTVNLPRHFGFLMQWELIGPFDNTDRRGFAEVFPPETKLDFGASYAGKAGAVHWVDFTTRSDDGKVDLNKTLGKANGVTAYAAAKFVAHQPGAVEVRLGTPNAHKLWLNGKLISAREAYHAGTSMDQYTGRGRLKAGTNWIVLKICQNEQTESWAQAWEFQLRVCDSTGAAILSVDRPPETRPGSDENALNQRP